MVLIPVCKGQLFKSSWKFPPLSTSPPSASLNPGALPNGFQNSVSHPQSFPNHYAFCQTSCCLAYPPPLRSPLSTHTRPRCHATVGLVYHQPRPHLRIAIKFSPFIVTLTYQWHVFFSVFCLLFWYCCLLFWSIVFMMVVFINQLCKVLLRAWKAARSSSFLPSLA